MYRVWRNGMPHHIECCWAYLPKAERIDRWNGKDWEIVMLDYEWLD